MTENLKKKTFMGKYIPEEGESNSQNSRRNKFIVVIKWKYNHISDPILNNCKDFFLLSLNHQWLILREHFFDCPCTFHVSYYHENAWSN
jgi:hypothetical protein